ncbi:MAG TPA: glycoside hydrolase family 1 protein [Candidatus Paceibacterota bacterium]|nr:glycoside hydrolase family 1 protein [Candidatus Paceibacterota bacterium]
MKKVLKFPFDFYWGTATASHQIEGGQNNDWSVWEKKVAKKLAKNSKKSFKKNPNWQKFQSEAENPDNYISGQACDSWNKFEEDFNIIQFLGLKAYRFSIEWSRIEPEEGKFDEQAIARYKKMITSLRARKIEPFVTLWHWTLPIWLAEKGGTTAIDFPEKFANYAEKLAESFGSEVKFWVTLNEPEIQSSHAYMKGLWPPQKKSILLTIAAIKNLISAHKMAFAVIKRQNKDAQIGVAKHQVAFEMARPTIWNKILKKIADKIWNFYFLDEISEHQDFIGLNHYNRNVINGWYGKNPKKVQTDFGWEFYPESIYQCLVELRKYNKPVYITENGLADAHDDLREEFIRRSLVAIHNAISVGIDVRGYFYWSLLDNFEWDKGYWLKFGLVAVDRETTERKVRDSAYVYKDIVEDGFVENDEK